MCVCVCVCGVGGGGVPIRVGEKTVNQRKPEVVCKRVVQGSSEGLITPLDLRA